MKRMLIVALFAFLVGGCGGPRIEDPSGVIVKVQYRDITTLMYNPEIAISGKSLDIDKEGNIVIVNPMFIGGGGGWVAEMKIEGDKAILRMPIANVNNYRVVVYHGTPQKK